MIKTEVLEIIRTVLTEKKTFIQETIRDLQAGLANDTKSSAGDKYETSREMSNQELEKISVQLNETNRQLALLHQIEQSGPATCVISGSLLHTTNGYFLIGIPVGTITVKETAVYCISAGAPIAQVFLNRRAGDTILFGGKEIKLISVS